jgi:hypothetical protein
MSGREAMVGMLVTPKSNKKLWFMEVEVQSWACETNDWGGLMGETAGVEKAVLSERGEVRLASEKRLPMTSDEPHTKGDAIGLMTVELVMLAAEATNCIASS